MKRSFDALDVCRELKGFIHHDRQFAPRGIVAVHRSSAERARRASLRRIGLLIVGD